MRKNTRNRIKVFRNICSLVGLAVIGYGLYRGGQYIIDHCLWYILMGTGSLIAATLIVIGAVQVGKDTYHWWRQRKTLKSRERLLTFHHHK